jgi:hypothetical protein
MTTPEDIVVKWNDDHRHINIEIPGRHAVLVFFGEGQGSDGSVNTFAKFLPGEDS